MVGRRVVIVRHGERVDFTFTDEWIKSCFSDNNTYVKHNLNMPDAVPKRDSPRLFLRDCPLTKVGELQAFITGQGIAEEKVLKDDFEVFVSPALRSVQTAAGIAKGMNKDFKMKIETGLFEWMGWFRDFKPTWMTVEEYKYNGYHVDESYTPFTDASALKHDEELDEYYERSYLLMQHLIDSTDKDLLLVAHGASLDTLTRQLMGGSIRTLSDMMNILRNISYCGTAVIEQDEKNKKWSVISLPRLTMRHAGCSDFEAAKQLGTTAGR